MTSGPRAGASPGKPRGTLQGPCGLPTPTASPPHPIHRHGFPSIGQWCRLRSPTQDKASCSNPSAPTHTSSAALLIWGPLAGWEMREMGRAGGGVGGQPSPQGLLGEGGTTSWGQLRKLRWSRHTGGLWLVDIEKDTEETQGAV